jgi:hypothetical protein
MRRNQFNGPHYADTDLALMKTLYHREALNVQIGANAFNLFNHPNFALPAANIAGGGLGTISSIAAPATSPYGSFQGAGVGGVLLRSSAKSTSDLLRQKHSSRRLRPVFSPLLKRRSPIESITSISCKRT